MMFFTSFLKRVKAHQALMIFLVLFNPVFGQDQNRDVEYWRKYGGMPALDIRISLDGKPVQGVFESARQKKMTGKGIPFDDILIPAIVGQRFKYKVEISPRDKEQWVDVTQHNGLDITAFGQQVRIDRRKAELTMTLDDSYPTVNPGIVTINFLYYAARNPQDEDMAFNSLYFHSQLKH